MKKNKKENESSLINDAANDEAGQLDEEIKLVILSVAQIQIDQSEQKDSEMLQNERLSKLVKQLTDLISIPSNTADLDAVNKVGEKMMDLTNHLPIEWSTTSTLGSANFYIGRTKIDHSRPVFIFSGHMDVVPSVFEAHVEAGKLIGSGSSDMKGGLVAMLGVLERMHEEGVLDNVIIALNSEEEIGSPHHALTMTELAKEGDITLVFESTDRSESEDETIKKIVKSRKGALVYEIDLTNEDSSIGATIEKTHDQNIKRAELILAINKHAGYQEATTINLGVMAAGTEYRQTTEKLIKVNLTGPGGHSGNLEKAEDRKSTLNAAAKMVIDIEQQYNGEIQKVYIAGLGGGEKVNGIPAKSEIILQIMDPNLGEEIIATIKQGADNLGLNCEFEEATEIPIQPSGSIVGEFRFKKTSELERVRAAIETECASFGAVEKPARFRQTAFFPALVENEQTRRIVEIAQGVAKKMNFTLVAEDRAGSSDGNHFSHGNSKMVVLDGLGPFGQESHTPREWVDIESIAESIDYCYELIRAIGDSYK